MASIATEEVLHALSCPAPSTCKAETIDFVKLGMPLYKDHFAMLIHDLLTPSECEKLLKAAESSTSGWEQALVNIGYGQQALMTDVRLCDRIIWDEKNLVKLLQDRIIPHLPTQIVTLEKNASVTGKGPVKRKEVWKLSRLNERLRFLRYTEGMYFRPHQDGSYITPDGEELSFLTVHLYLNGSASDADLHELESSHQELPLRGGATRFFGETDEDVYDINPMTGACLVFQHRNLVHSGDDVLQGVKYTLRTDIMYRKTEKM